MEDYNSVDWVEIYSRAHITIPDPTITQSTTSDDAATVSIYVFLLLYLRITLVTTLQCIVTAKLQNILSRGLLFYDIKFVTKRGTFRKFKNAFHIMLINMCMQYFNTFINYSECSLCLTYYLKSCRFYKR